MLALALIVMGVVPQEVGPVVDRCDRCERNWMEDDEHRLVFCQLIFWEALPTKGGGLVERVKAWRIVDLERGTYEGVCYAYPKAMHIQHDNRVLFFDKHDGLWREVRFDCFTESLTRYDPEAADRQIWPKEWRSGLQGEVR